MKFEVLKEVIIDGSTYAVGSEVDVIPDRVHRLVNLGFIAPVHQEKKVETRVVKAKSSRKKKDEEQIDIEELTKGEDE